jgi:hypothetical protein
MSGSSPSSTSRNIIPAARMKAVIWLRDRLEAHTPMPAMPAASSPAPTYCARMVPLCRSAPAARPSGMASVSASAIQRKSTEPTYLPSSSSSSLSGWASTTSICPLRMSSASARMVTAGTKKRNSQGRRSSMGRRLAVCERKAWRKKRKPLIARNTTSRT